MMQLIFSFLSGSFIGVVTKELINFYVKKKDFEREIIKITYQKKLEKAELAISFYNNIKPKISDVISCLKIMIEELKKRNFEKNIDHIQKVLNDSLAKVDLLEKEKFYEINSVLLYFDFPEIEEEKNIQRQQLILNAVGVILDFNREINLLRGQNSFAEYYEKNLLESIGFDHKLNNVIKNLDFLVSIYKENLQNAKNVISILKDGVKNTIQ